MHFALFTWHFNRLCLYKRVEYAREIWSLTFFDFSEFTPYYFEVTVSSKFFCVPTLLLFSNPFRVSLGGSLLGVSFSSSLRCLSLMLLSYFLWARRSSALRCPAECLVRATSDCAFLALFARFIAKKCGKSQKNAVK